MDPRKKHTVFLSRVSSEFKEFTDRIRASKIAYPWLRLIDQEAPDGKTEKVAAKITTDKLRDWIRESDTVFHYVGYRSGSVANIPPSSDLAGIEQALDATCNEHLQSLRAHFESTLTTDSVDAHITYTMIEAILALGFGKDLFLFWLDEPRPHGTTIQSPAPDPAQNSYREWIYQKHITGRTRISMHFPEDSIVSSHRQLQSLNNAIALEYRANFSLNQTPIWESVEHLADPATSTDDLESLWKSLREKSKSTSIDWIRHTVDVRDDKGSHALAPEPIFRTIPSTEQSLHHEWLIPCRSKLHRLTIDSSELRSEAWPSIPGQSVRAACIADSSIWVLTETSTRQFFLRQLCDFGSSKDFPLSGFNTHGFHPIQLTYGDGRFWLTYQGQVWQVSIDLLKPIWNALPVEQDQQSSRQTSSGFAEQISLPRSFPFRRGFEGHTYDSRSLDQTETPWAVVKDRQKLVGITIQPGCFLDLFKTVDIEFDQYFHANLLEFPIIGNPPIVHGRLYSADKSQYIDVPLFPCRPECTVSWRHKQSKLQIFETAVSTQTIAWGLLQICPQCDGQFEPSCFVARERTNNQTRLRVWLIPVAANGTLCTVMNPFLNSLEALPKSPLCSLDDVERFRNDGINAAQWSSWHRSLWIASTT